MSRSALLLVNIYWQAFVVTAVYYFLYAYWGNSLVIWAALAGWILSIPVPYLFGSCFLQKIYAMKIEKYTNLVDLRFKDVQKEERDELERDAVIN
jgi:hypothetical protein